MNAFKKNGGFTLVELIIVIAILAILSSVAVAGYSSYITKANTSAVNSELNNISSAAVLANAQAGDIAGIKVTYANKTLSIEVNAAAFAENFDTEFCAVTGAKKDTTNTATATLKYYTLSTAANWGSSDFKTNEANWSANKWTPKSATTTTTTTVQG